MSAPGRPRTRPRYRALLGLAVLLGPATACTPAAPRAPRLDRCNFVAGTQTILPAYQFTHETSLVETARRIREMGATVIKISMSPRYSGVEYHLPARPEIRSLKTLAELEPSFRRVFAMDFSSYVMWAYCFSQYRGGQGQNDLVSFRDGLSDAEAAAVYREMYDLAAYLLTAYSGTGKTFYLGHWEGDWHLRPSSDPTQPVSDTAVAGMIRWLRVRQKAIDDARRRTPHHDVAVYGYTEVNLVRRGMAGARCVTTDVLPHVDVDYVSYSAWDATNRPRSLRWMRMWVFASLDFIESHLRPRPGLPPGRRVWIGEFGYPAIRFTQAEADRRTRWVLRAGLEWGCPFVLYWELYNNELTPEGRQRGYWMIDDEGRPTLVLRTYRAYYREARAFASAFFRKHGRLPRRDELARAALSFTSLR